jgi:hypothetical protein
VLGSGDSIGSLVGNMVVTNTKLQRIVARCGCEFYYASFDDELEAGLEAVPASNTVRSHLKDYLSSVGMDRALSLSFLFEILYQAIYQIPYMSFIFFF